MLLIELRKPQKPLYGGVSTIMSVEHAPLAVSLLMIWAAEMKKESILNAIGLIRLKDSSAPRSLNL